MAKGVGVGGGGGRLFEEGDCFKYFRQRGAIIGGRRLLEGRRLVEEIRYLSFSSYILVPLLAFFNAHFTKC